MSENPKTNRSTMETSGLKHKEQIQHTSKNSKDDLLKLLKIYLTNVTKDSSKEEMELEVKFGTIGGKHNNITKIQHENVIKKILSSGFYQDKNEYLLRIQSEYNDQRTNKLFMSNIRTEINGLQNIRKYCQTNKIDSISSNDINHIKKHRLKDNDFSSVDFIDFNYRVSLNKEEKIDTTSSPIITMLENWNKQKKTFRYLNRFKFRHNSFPIIIDISIVKESNKKDNRFYIPEYNIHDSGVFTSEEKYEIEIEVLNNNVGIGSLFNTPDILNNNILKPVIKYILAGIQETNYPIGFNEKTNILDSYMKLLWRKEYDPHKRVNASNFVGPSSVTLKIENIRPLNADSNITNIRNSYTVTDKADGERKLLFIDPNGKIYLINTNMSIQFTGVLSKNKEVWNTLIDGEHILYNKNKKFINMYAAFDIYYINGKDIRSNAFVSNIDDSSEVVLTQFRLPLLEKLIKNIYAVSVVKESTTIPLNIICKQFYVANSSESIFECCEKILTKETNGIFEYETDGLIFTPSNYGVSTNTVGQYVKPTKFTWDQSFKWKPPQFNTIDFLVSVKKHEDGTDMIGSTFNEGVNVLSNSQIEEFKTVILCVGIDEYNEKHGFINPYQSMIDDKIPIMKNDDNRSNYVPAQFFPTEPYDHDTGICNIKINNTNNSKQMYTENNEIIEDNSIVEFRYEMHRDKYWQWIPMRMRYDKTAQLRNGIKNYGNGYHVANSNWQTIHNPVTHSMITSGLNIHEQLSDDDVYYNTNSGISMTQGLRDFHNLYVKKSLINAISKPGNTLIDLAVGKGGDWPKWIKSRLKFVFGIDIARDNIHNRKNGACARYITNKHKFKTIPSALFVNGNSSVNIRKTTGIVSDKDKQITRAVFGQGPKDIKILGPGVYKNYGIASDGFDICSIQFAIHYMFKDQETLQNFLQNVSEVTKEGGYFIGTSYDGEKVFNMLKNYEQNESNVIMSSQSNKQQKMWEVTKKYDNNEYNDDETCIGYAIDVFQESINKTFREYLVNYTYLTRILENYGFVLVSNEELEKLKSSIKNGTGSFKELFNKMNEDIQKDEFIHKSYGDASHMSEEERTISFLNRYFIYKKIRKITNISSVSDNLKTAVVDDSSESSIDPTSKQIIKETIESSHEKSKVPDAVITGTVKISRKNLGKTKKISSSDKDIVKPVIKPLNRTIKLVKK